ncbi:methyl-CpG-binding domain protein 2-like, partial [Rhincodon typus]|uniref:methyl-CpG-binding domain protein 2-like n=1 Tax=Rhincodon typus TaxID=259920 RepID=UPI00202DF6FD
LFWEKRLQGLSACDIAEQIIKSMELPKGLQGIGPGHTNEALLSAIASALHTSSGPITGQVSAAVEKNPAVWLNTYQPLCRAFVVTDKDISRKYKWSRWMKAGLCDGLGYVHDSLWFFAVLGRSLARPCCDASR